MIVICCGMMRSGSTLQYQLAVAILEHTGTGKGLGEIRQCEFSELEPAYPDDRMTVVKLHQLKHLKGAKEALNSGKALGLYSYRDIRDVTVSLMKMRKTSFEQLVFKTKEIPECLENFELWTANSNVLVSQYETMIHDLSSEVLKIANHLKINLSTEIAQKIAEEHTLERQKNRIQQWQKNLGRSSQTFEPKTLLHASHINSGRPKQWQVGLNRFQIGYLETIAENWLKEHNYSISQPLYIRWLSQLIFSKYLISQKIKRLTTKKFKIGFS